MLSPQQVISSPEVVWGSTWLAARYVVSILDRKLSFWLVRMTHRELETEAKLYHGREQNLRTVKAWLVLLLSRIPRPPQRSEGINGHGLGA